jgi:glycosyltransferase involved in cell wall biosynthesis
LIIVIDSIDDGEWAQQMLKESYFAQNINVIRNNTNIGVSEARNVGLSHIKNQFYTIIDQDDLVTMDYFTVLENQLNPMVSVHILNGVIRYVNEGIDIPIYTFKPQFAFKSLILKETFIYTPGLLVFNSKLVPPKGLFLDTSDKYKGCDDWAAYLNIMLSSSNSFVSEFIDESLFVYCLHSTNYSNDKQQMIMSSIAVLDYISSHNQLNSARKLLVNKARGMQDFYLSRDVDKISMVKLLLKYPSQFLSQYVFAFFNLESTNKIILKIKYHLTKKGLLKTLPLEDR